MSRFYDVRSIGEMDIPTVVEIERLSFAVPWSADQFRRSMKERNSLGKVVLAGGVPVGYIIFTLDDCCIHIRNLAVHPGHRRRGLAAAMICYADGRLGHRNYLVTETTATNVTAQVFFRSCGFRCVAIYDRWFDDDQEAYVFHYDRSCPYRHEFAPQNRISHHYAQGG